MADPQEQASSNGRDEVTLLKFPYPYEAAVTVASDIDNASVDRFSAIHALFCGSGLIERGGRHWQTLGLTPDSVWYDASQGGVPGLGLDLSDSFFLIGDDVTMGMYRHDSAADRFVEDVSDGHNACQAIRKWLKAGRIEAFHTFLHYTREQVVPLLEDFYRWCEQEGVPKPRVWTNHSMTNTPSGICPDAMHPFSVSTLFRQIARATIGPLFGRKRVKVNWRQEWYRGDSPGSPYYVNDLLADNGLRYVWLNAGGDALENVIALPETTCGGRASILDVVTMDDGVKYFRFPRCYGRVDAPPGVWIGFRQSENAFDSSALFTEENLRQLCDCSGTCILFTHWTQRRALPIQDETIGHLQRVRRFRDEGRIWVTTLTRLLEWTRIRAFLRFTTRREQNRLVIDVDRVEDPVVGKRKIQPADCDGLTFRIPGRTDDVLVTFAGRSVEKDAVALHNDLCVIRGRSGD